MKKFKIVDMWISICLILFFLVLAIIKQDNSFITGYFVTGGWQLVSMIVHAIAGWFTGSKSPRRTYHYGVVIIFIAAAVGLLLIPMLIILLYALLVAAPFMALYYTGLCWAEIRSLQHRPLSILK